MRNLILAFALGAFTTCAAPALASGDDMGRAVRALERIASALERCK